ncbi:hypothetical protein BSI_19890 [Bacillus inaquosorum KCTC 13429]|uniref:Uncharacterized protein n=1 Tax=Bacillus inaquosorum KCTC 13429 TaxID=1236548 RepID=A0A9W5LJ55_9BACI|nr:hypothetical protein BSI_19890 [Bacillus inaquosorum KCTC 13429]
MRLSSFYLVNAMITFFQNTLNKIQFIPMLYMNPILKEDFL